MFCRWALSPSLFPTWISVSKFRIKWEKRSLIFRIPCLLGYSACSDTLLSVALNLFEFGKLIIGFIVLMMVIRTRKLIKSKIKWTYFWIPDSSIAMPCFKSSVTIAFNGFPVSLSALCGCARRAHWPNNEFRELNWMINAQRWGGIHSILLPCNSRTDKRVKSPNSSGKTRMALSRTES